MRTHFGLDIAQARGNLRRNVHQESRDASKVPGGNRAGSARHGAEASPGVGNDADETSDLVKNCGGVAAHPRQHWMLSML